jgi:hypothetical protein
MSDEPHDVVKLLIARMESHPEEFRVADAPFHDRWYDHVNSIQAFGNEADKAAMAAGLRKIRLAETHERVMDELLNGEDRRRKVEEDREYERNLSKSLLLTKHQMVQQATQGLQNAYANAYPNQLSPSLGQLGQASGVYDADRDMYRSAGGIPPTKLYGDYGSILPVANGGTGSTIINQIKRRLGKGK